ncbi:MAG: DUF296 domain-containing protein [Planctomycetota bacterium]|nr:DUF296 domain-containing protein [Planctomycetota bacterium]
MEYEVGELGRVIVARGFNGEDLYSEIESIAAKADIRSAAVVLLGALRSAKMVVGPKNFTGPIEPMFKEFDDAREIAGVGTIFCDETGPKLHLHAAVGRGGETITGCPRGGATIFSLVEVVIYEIKGVNATRKFDAEFGFKALTLGDGK